MLNIFVFVAGCLNLVLAWLVFTKNRHALSNVSFSILSCILAIWAFAFIPYNIPIIFDSVFWIKFIYILVIGMVGVIYYFSYAFPDNQEPPRLGVIIYILLNIPVALILLFTNYFVSGVQSTPHGLETKLGPFYPVASLIWGAFAAFSLREMLHKYHISTGRSKLQLHYMFLGLALFSIGAIILDGIIPIVFHTSIFFSLSAALSLIFITLTTYSIIRYRLMDLRIAFREIIVFVLVSIAISAIFSTSAVSYWIFTGVPVKTSVVTIIVLVSAISTLIFDNVSRYIKSLASKYLFQSIYDYQKTLRQLSSNLSSYLEMPKLVDIIINVLMQTMKLNRVAVLIRDFTDNHYKIQRTIGFNEANGIGLVKDNFLTTYLEVHPQMIVLEEIKNLTEDTQNLYEKDRLKQLYDHMERIEAALIIPVINTNRVISLIVLGNKISGDPYTIQDVDLLQTIASQASIAIENARLYQEVSLFNQNLQEKINTATAELRAKNLDLEKAYQDLKVLDKLKDDFVSVVSHELRTPMTAIRSYVWMALNRPDVALSERIKRYLERTFFSTERLISLVNDMLNVSRIEAGRIEIKLQAVNLSTLVKDIVLEMKPRAQEKEINLSVIPVATPLVTADPDKVREVMMNLIGNAIKFTPLEGSVTIKFFSDGLTVETSVQDTGVGVSHDDLPRLFQRFGRLDNSYVAAATSGGTGLGLYISKRLIELMGGKIWATSEGLGRGATFTFSLPMATPAVVAQAEKYSHTPTGEAKPLETVVI